MKKYFIILAVFSFMAVVNSAYSLPQFWYSGVAMNSSGSIITESDVNVKILINDGENLYEEYHYSVPVNEFGLFAVFVGNGDTEDDLNDIQMKPLTSIVVGVGSGDSYITVEGQSLVSVYKRSFEGGISKGSRTSLQQAYIGGNEINIVAEDESTEVARPVIIRNTNTHANLVLDNQNDDYYNSTWANALTIQRGSTVLSTYHADGENSTEDLYPFGFASVIFVDQDIYSLPPGRNGQILYLVNTNYEEVITVIFGGEGQMYLPVFPGTSMHLVSDGYNWFPVMTFPWY